MSSILVSVLNSLTSHTGNILARGAVETESFRVNRHIFDWPRGHNIAYNMGELFE